jgi:hypothetical protein
MSAIVGSGATSTPEPNTPFIQERSQFLKFLTNRVNRPLLGVHGHKDTERARMRKKTEDRRELTVLAREGRLGICSKLLCADMVLCMFLLGFPFSMFISIISISRINAQSNAFYCVFLTLHLLTLRPAVTMR